MILSRTKGLEVVAEEEAEDEEEAEVEEEDVDVAEDVVEEEIEEEVKVEMATNILSLEMVLVLSDVKDKPTDLLHTAKALYNV